MSAATDPPLLAGEDISVSFGGVKAVRGVDIAVRSGQIVAVVGPNGAGKTTLLNALSGFVRKSGTVRFRGEPLTKGDPRTLAGLGIARSFQHTHFIERASVLENVLVGAHLNAGYSPWQQVFLRRTARKAEQAMTGRAEALLDYVQVAPKFWSRPVTELPHGARKRIDVARALMQRPTLLMMDEPTAGMGEGEREIVQSLMMLTRERRGTTILMVGHHMDFIRAVADRVVALDTGAVLKEGTPDEVLESDEFIVASVGRKIHDAVDNDVITQGQAE